MDFSSFTILVFEELNFSFWLHTADLLLVNLYWLIIFLKFNGVF